MTEYDPEALDPPSTADGLILAYEACFWLARIRAHRSLVLGLFLWSDEYRRSMVQATGIEPDLVSRAREKAWAVVHPLITGSGWPLRKR